MITKRFPKYIDTEPIKIVCDQYYDQEYVVINQPSLRQRLRKIKVQCPLCKDRRLIDKRQFRSNNHTYCRGCSKKYDLRGIRFNRLICLDYAGKDKNSHSMYSFLCDCGNEIIAQGNAVIHNLTKSCGCLLIEHNWQWKGLSGKDHPNYNHDLTLEDRQNKQRYYIPGYKDFIKSVFQRDNFTCQACFVYGGRLEVHHIYDYSHYPELATNLGNGITLCRPCHRQFHFDFMTNQFESCTEDDFLAYLDWLNQQ